MTIAQIIKQFDKVGLATASKLTIRELEEEEKGHWVAYVDEGNESHDVHVILIGKQVEDTSCDCGGGVGQLCAHQTKMLLILEDKLKGKKVVDKLVSKKTLSKKKVSESEILLRASDQEIVYEWLIKTFASNKVLEQDFILSFSAPECKEYTVNDVVSIVKTIASSSFKVKRNADANTVKEFIRLLNLAIEPIEKFTVFNITKPLALDIYLCIIEEVLTLKRGVKTTSTRLNTFVEKLIEKYALSLLNVNDKNAVYSSISVLFKRIKDTRDFFIYGVLLKIIKSVYNLADTTTKGYCAEESMKLASNLNNSRGQYSDVFLFLLKVVVENDLLNRCYSDFIDQKGDEDYNVILYRALSTYDANLVIKKCKFLLITNSRSIYNDEYRKILKTIYEERQDIDELVKIKKDSTLYGECTLEDYVYISEHLEDKNELIKFRSKISQKLRFSGRRELDRELVYFEIMNYEKKYKKMLESLSSSNSQAIVWRFREVLYNCHPANFLERVFRVGQYSHYDEEDNVDLANYIASKYSKDAILKVYKDYTSYSSTCLNKLIVELAENK